MRRKIAHATAAICLAYCLLPAAASAQSTITGVVADSSGAVLPGVTVEAASPALIEKIRTAVTDAEGRYVIVNLRPGTYSVTFTLPGFSPFVRDAMTLPSDFTATVNAELRVGSIQETVTVSGEAPVVDVQSTQRTTVLERELVDALPTGRTFQAIGALVVGVRVSIPNVGGTRSATNQRLTAYGSLAKDTTIDVDGMKANSTSDGGDDQADHNDGMTGEFTVQIKRVVRVGKLQIEPGVDVYNIFNSNVVLTQNQNFGSALGQPQQVLQGRLVRVNAQINF